jgi:hypothetical protein
MAKGDHPYKKRVVGSKNGGYVRSRVQIGFDDKVRKEIIARSKANNRSFASEVRYLVEAALRNFP